MPSTTEISQVGKREDLSDIIAVADAKNCPLTTMLRKGKKPGNTLMQWQADSYAAPTTDGVPDGQDVETYEDAAANRAILSGRVQHFRRTAKVTTLAQEVSVIAGIPEKEFARAKAKKTIELKRDLETALLSDNDSVEASGATAYKTRGLGSWLASTAQTDLPVPAAYRTPSGSIFSSALTGFDEVDLIALLQSRWDQTGAADELVGIVGSALKAKISEMSKYAPNQSGYTAVRRYNDGDDATVTAKVDVFEGDFGTVTLHLGSFLPNTKRGYLLDMKMLELRSVFAPRFEELPNLGGGRRGLVETIAGLCVLNPLAHCKIAAS
jgi:hypothetical protein